MTVPWTRRARWAFVLVLAAAATVLLFASDQGSASSATATASGAKRVNIANFAFHPPTLRVKRGARVVFVNSSNVAHTATQGGSFDTHKIKPGTSKGVRFESKGTFSYHCKIHPFMKGKIVVE
ncbi:MAG TPA: cupredoxin domain-containing protein [Solirubrobacterales bacterium]|nr:cupredoxin domain-containing protein [Solirubrobacterales bacterium]